MPSLRPFLFLSVCLCIVLVAVDSLAIRVCQNKDCCKGFKGQSSLPRLLRDLEVDQVDTSGCLSLCNKGPNLHVVIAREDNNEQYVHQVTDPITAIVAVETIYGPQHVKIKAAVRCMEEGQKGTTKNEFFY
jgi:(2Fe-2S) ferredoxin